MPLALRRSPIRPPMPRRTIPIPRPALCRIPLVPHVAGIDDDFLEFVSHLGVILSLFGEEPLDGTDGRFGL